MGRSHHGALLKIQRVQKISSYLVVRVGDVLWFTAIAGHVQPGGEVVKMQSALIIATLVSAPCTVAPGRVAFCQWSDAWLA